MFYFQIGMEDVRINIFQKCLSFLENVQLPKAGETLEIGNGIRCTISHFSTTSAQNASWEAHKKYIDLHCVLAGAEKIRIAPTMHSKIGTYHEEQDYLELNGIASSEIVLRPGFALCLFPNDAHQVKLQVCEGDETAVTKAVFKIPLTLFQEEFKGQNNI